MDRQPLYGNKTGTLKRRIITYPDRILTTRTEPIENIDGDLQDFIDAMAETMYAAPGVGLAANQVGELKRVFVYDLSPKDAGRNPSVIINPEIILTEGSLVHEEACLSVIDFSADVTRSLWIKVRGVDRDGNPVDIEAENLEAICLQHEIDHLNGVLFLDHLSSLKRALYKKKREKSLKKEQSPDLPM